MAHRRGREPSPLRSGLVHASLSVLVFGGVATALGAGIHVSGDASAASPRATLALFDNAGDTRPSLKARLKSETVQIAGTEGAPADMVVPTAEPDLGIEYSDNQSLIVDVEEVTGQGGPETPGVGIRINGQLVRPGESLSQVTKIASPSGSPSDGLEGKLSSNRLTKATASGPAPADRYARAFANPENKPVVALVVGGLGINGRHTQSAIDELPAEITFSFAPDARNLQKWIDAARADGHEVMLEVPMEAHGYGRMRMHPQTLQASLDTDSNIANLSRVLGKATGYFGVINYQGAKFAEVDAAFTPVLDALSERGVAFVEDGSLQRTNVNRLVDQASVRYASATLHVDSKLTASDINAQLLELETAARQKGSAMGTGYAYPITIEMAKAWTDSLADKGLILAPASALTAVTPETITTGSLQEGSVNTSG